MISYSRSIATMALYRSGSVTLIDRWPGFQGQHIFRNRTAYLRNGTRYSHS